MPFPKILLAASVAAVHSFAAANVITEAPTPTLAPRQVAGAPGTPILSTLRYAYTDLPYQVYPFPVLRGPQFGFNQCNSTTEGPNSNCQTLIFNSISDFCLWGSPEVSGSIGNDEAKVVAFCTKPGHGTRVFPAGSITGLQWTKTPGYIQVVGFIKNEALNLVPGDDGGELDPHGADLQGNPLGGVVYSNSTPDANGQLSQVFNWNTFVGGGRFCFKACYNTVLQPDFCENRYDLIGCDYNMPSAAQDGQFTECEGENQDVVGVYTVNGQVSTWSMPDPVTPPPYTPRIPASTNCKTWASTDLFAGAPTATGGSTSTTATGTGTNTATTGKSTAGSTGSKTSGTTATNTNQPGSAANIKVPFTALGAVVGLVALGGMLL